MSVTMQTFSAREEWLAARRGTIGGSSASAIVGRNPYMTNVELWLELTGQYEPEDISDKPYVQYGLRAEEHLRELFKLDYPEYRVFYAPNNLWVNDKYPFAHASLDGWLEDDSGRKGILEIKTTTILQSMQKESWKGRIPDNYFVQILHYFIVTEFDFAILKAQLRYDYSEEVRLVTNHYYIERADVEEDIDFLLKKEASFSEQIKHKRRPAQELPAI